MQAKALTYRSIERLQQQIQVYGDSAVVSGHAHIDVLIGGVPRLVNLRYLSVWAKQAQGWQTVAFQSTPVPG